MVLAFVAAGGSIARAGPPDRIAAPTLARELARRAGPLDALSVDESLSRAARRHAREVLDDERRARRDRIDHALQAEGLPDSQVLPFAGVGSNEAALAEAARAFTDERAVGRGLTHLGVAVERSSSGDRVALVVLFVRRLVDLAPLARKARPPELVVRGSARVAARGWTGALTRPDGEVVDLEVRRAGPAKRRLTTVVPLREGPGRYTFELLAVTERGPEVAALWTFHVGIPVLPIAEAEVDPSPSPSADRDPRRDLLARVERARSTFAREQLEHEPALERAAQAHADAVCAAMLAAHVLPGGPEPNERAQKHGYAGAVLENVAIGPSIARVHENLLMSPSHRKNVLERRAHAIGIGVASRGSSVCVVELFGL